MPPVPGALPLNEAQSAFVRKPSLSESAGGIERILPVESIAIGGTTLSDVAYFPDGVAAAIPDLSSGCSAMGLSTFLPTGAPSFQFVNFNDTNDPYGLAITPDGSSVLVTMELEPR